MRAVEPARTLPPPLPPEAVPEAPADLASTLAAAQRRLRRLALDLHDGPAQDVAALAADAALLQDALAGEQTPERVAASRSLATELRERLAALASDLRDLAEVLEPRSMLSEPIGAILGREADAFARRAGFAPRVEVEEELGPMTASQQIALTRVAREALTNVRQHADATSASVEVRATARGVSLVVEDDGRGFSVTEVANEGSRPRLGLAGMQERIRLLGGTLTVESRAGGPTRVSATIPRWGT